MKNVLMTLTMLACLLQLSCEMEESIYDQKRNNIVGKWEVTQASQEIRSDTVYRESARVFMMDFNEDGTGKMESVLSGADYVYFEWWYQFEPEYVLTVFDSEFINPSVGEFEVVKNEKDRQIWEWQVVPENSPVDVYLHTWKMNPR